MSKSRLVRRDKFVYISKIITVAPQLKKQEQTRIYGPVIYLARVVSQIFPEDGKYMKRGRDISKGLR